MRTFGKRERPVADHAAEDVAGYVSTALGGAMADDTNRSGVHDGVHDISGENTAQLTGRWWETYAAGAPRATSSSYYGYVYRNGNTVYFVGALTQDGAC